LIHRAEIVSRRSSGSSQGLILSLRQNPDGAGMIVVLTMPVALVWRRDGHGTVPSGK
jgi:hypothetical protein